MSAPPASARGLRLTALLLALLGFGCLVPTFFSETLLVDDRILLRQDVRVLDPSRRGEIWTRPLFARELQGGLREQAEGPSLYYRPLVLQSMAWTRDVFGDDPLPHHALNVLLHLVVGLLLWRLLLPRHYPRAAAAGALVLLVHPAVSEPVGWIVGRADLMATGATLGVLLLLLHPGADATPPPPARVALAALLFLGACLSKETALLLAPLLPLATALRFRRPLPGVVAAVAGAGVFLLLRSQALPVGPPPGVEWSLHPGVLAGSAFRYLQHLLLPYDLQVLFYDPELWRPRARLLDVAALVVALAGAVGLLGVLRGPGPDPARRRARLVAALGAGFLVLPLLPLLGWIRLGYPFSDRYLYAPAAGLGMLVAAAMIRLPPPRARVVAAALCLWLTANAATLLGRSRAWTDATRLLATTLEAPFRPPRAFVFAAENYLVQHRFDEMLAVVEEGLAEHPAIDRLRILRGTALRALGRPEDAEAAFLDVQEGGLLFAASRAHAAYLRRMRGDMEGARRLLDAAVEANPTFHPAVGQRGELALSQGRIPEALEDLRRARDLAPADPHHHFNLGLALRAAGEPERALEEIRAAAERAPHEARFAGAVGQLLAELGRREEAARWLLRAQEEQAHGH